MIKSGNCGKEGLKLKKILTTNLALKILAFVFALLLWLIVVNINDPIIKRTIPGIHVEILNPEAITGEGKIYEVLDNTDTISVVISAKRSIINEINESDITAVANMEELTFMDTIGIDVYSDIYDDKIESIKASSDNVKVFIDNMGKTQLQIQVNTTGSPEAGYLIGNVSTDQTLVRLSGPESAVLKVAKAVATVDISGMTTDVSTSVDVKLYDEEDNLITDSSIKRHIDAVKVSVEILGTKTVPLGYSVMGTPIEGYELTGIIESTPNEIIIAGKKSVLDAIEKIEIPEAALNVTGQSSDMTAIVDISKYIPDRTSIANSNFNGKATVIVYIEKKVTETASIFLKNLRITNPPEGFTAEIIDYEEAKMITISGLQGKMSAIDLENISGTIDIAEYMVDNGIENLSPGIYEIGVLFNLPEGVKTDLVFTVYVQVSVEEE